MRGGSAGRGRLICLDSPHFCAFGGFVWTLSTFFRYLTTIFSFFIPLIIRLQAFKVHDNVINRIHPRPIHMGDIIII